MIDLHLHLDGSLSCQTVWTLAQQQHITLPVQTAEALKPFLTAPPDCPDLATYLKCFQIPLSVLQTPDAVCYATRELCQTLQQQGLLYAEIRFAPQLHTASGATMEQMVEAAARGVQESGFDARLILCAMRAEGLEEQNLQTVRLAKDFLGKSVVGVDLAGDEARYATQQFSPVFELARQLEVPFTVHAGEAAGSDSVRAAVEAGARRIGHGLNAAGDPELMDQIMRQQIAIEMCPSSNFQTKAVQQAEQYPLKRWLQSGVLVTINTDNLTVSDTCLRDEYRLIELIYGLTREEKQTLVRHAVQASFLPEAEKKALAARVEQAFAAEEPAQNGD